jgi:hypothetical protein
MRRLRRALPVTFAVLVISGCASSEEWSTWYAHRTHFASSEHMTFSVRHGEGSASPVTRRDIALASGEAWWGKAITVDPAQILER